ncbi:MAG: DUF1549 domain-containing protein [Bryobacterales bacterium]|nr:DUF1549 domain-containing protein [Bryobacterales bacterium]
MSLGAVRGRLKAVVPSIVLLSLCLAQASSVYTVNCTYTQDPEQYTEQDARAREDAFQRAAKFGLKRAVGEAPKAVPPGSIPRRNLIDDAIFDKLQEVGVDSAPLTTDEEFLRRITLDLTGRIPTPEQVRAFVANEDPDKRNVVIDQLLFSPEFTHKWTMWLGDLLQNTRNSANFSRQFRGRNAMYDWMRASITENKPLKDIVFEALTGRGNNYESATGAANYVLGGLSTGPAQDTYDLMMTRSASMFLGMGHYDCLVCHDGRRHLDVLSVWGKSATRLDAYRMSAFFSRTRRAQNNDRASDSYQSNTVTDAGSGTYDLTTNFGNRPNRTPIGTLRNLTPEYHFTGAKPATADWRAAFAENVMTDPMLARNFVNRLWKSMFNHGLVEPVDGLDPARLDPKNPPPAPWTLQASHPQLLEDLAQRMRDDNYNLREYLRLIAQSSAYQLSARYDGEWDLTKVPLFARHYPRRLMGEEVHDALQMATGIVANYTVEGWSETAKWAMELPEPVEPRSNGGANNFMNTFLRGNRDTLERRTAGSILQQLALMNDAQVINRVRVTASPVLRRIAGIPDNEAVVEEMFLTFLGRKPSEYEKGKAQEFLKRYATTAATRNTSIEDLGWALVNKVEFLFSY